MDMNEELFEAATKLTCNMGVGTANGTSLEEDTPEHEREIEAGYLIIHHPDLIIPVACMLSIEMCDSLIMGLQSIRDQITWSSPVFDLGSKSDANIN